MKPNEAVKLVARLKAAYPTVKLEPDTLQIYAEALSDLDATAAQESCSELLTKCKFFPTIAEIRCLVAEREANLEPAEVAWSGVIALVRSGDPRREPHWDNPCTAMAVRSVGWWTLCNSSKISFERSAFISTYERARELHLKGLNSGRLLTHAEKEGLLGFPKPGPRVGGVSAIGQLIGEVAKKEPE